MRSVPMFETVDPSTWIPDPYSDYVTEARWNFFEREMKMSELKELDKSKEDEIDGEGIDEETQATRTYRNVAQ